MTGAAFAGKLKPLRHYMRAFEPPDPKRTSAAILSVFQAMRSRGLPISIIKLER